MTSVRRSRCTLWQHSRLILVMARVLTRESKPAAQSRAIFALQPPPPALAWARRAHPHHCTCTLVFVTGERSQCPRPRSSSGVLRRHAGPRALAAVGLQQAPAHDHRGERAPRPLLHLPQGLHRGAPDAQVRVPQARAHRGGGARARLDGPAEHVHRDAPHAGVRVLQVRAHGDDGLRVPGLHRPAQRFQGHAPHAGVGMPQEREHNCYAAV
mmetsp:Transcript_52313/g.147279  ORF Transcript_52313/g.147279 Transcript_52313/m.147279 type:complete len:212 (-) Transcript_52313:711-1346(-)